MPLALQALAQVIPATHFLVVIRGIYLKGVEPSVYGPRAAALLLICLVLVGAAAARFRKDLE